MNLFVTGGTGFIGSHLVDRLLGEESVNRIACLIRKDERWLRGKDVEKVRGDLFSENAIQKALEGVDTVFHLAAVVMAKNEDTYRRVNVDAAKNLVRMAKKAGVKKMILLSSLAAAGPSFGRPLTEQESPHPISGYGRSKWAMEQEIARLADDSMDITILRPPAVYGPREDQIFTLFKWMNSRIMPMAGNGIHPKLSLMHVDDVVQGLMKALYSSVPQKESDGDESPIQQEAEGVRTYFLSGPSDVSWIEVKDAAEAAFQKRIFALKISSGTVLGIGSLAETLAGLFGKYPVMNREKSREMVEEWCCSHEKATRELGFEPEISLRDGIADTLLWYRRHGWL